MAALATIEHTDLITPLLPLHEQGVLTPTAFLIDQVLTVTGEEEQDEREIEQWHAIGAYLGALYRANLFWLADWLNFGENSWGEKFAQAIDATGLSEGRLSNIASVGRNVKPARRRGSLSFSHHEAVAKLEPDAQVEWLDKAETGDGTRRWATQELKHAMSAVDALPVRRAAPQFSEEAKARKDGPPIDPARIVKVARAVWKSATKDTSDPGYYRVPSEQFVQLAAALGVGQ